MYYSTCNPQTKQCNSIFLLSLTCSVALILMQIPSGVLAQGRGNLGITFKTDIPSPCTEMTMTMQADNLGRPYLYVAEKEGGLRVYDITNIEAPVLADTIPISGLGGLHVMNLSQSGNYLYLALGNHLGTNMQSSDMAIVDVTNPGGAFLLDHWVFPGPVGGGGIVKVEGNYAYLGAMLNGLIVLDVSDKHHIQFVSQFIPDKTYPTPKPDTTKYNARGMQVLNGVVYLCYDAGGFRIINTTDKLRPLETGRYSNPAVASRPRAYNNVVIDDTLAYVAVDYCGLEVLNFADTANVKLLSWWNPWSCDKPLVNFWFNSPGHANEIDHDKTSKLLFIATGKSDMHVVSVANPAAPDSCDNYGGVNNGLGTWGLSRFDNKIFLSYICTLGIPFASNWTGVKILTYTPTQSGIRDVSSGEDVHVYPSLVHDGVSITASNGFVFRDPSITVTDAIGRNTHVDVQRLGEEKLLLDFGRVSAGAYFLHIVDGDRTILKRIVKAGY